MLPSFLYEKYMRSEKSDEVGKNCDIVDLIQNYQVVIAIQSLLIILSLV